MRVFINHRKARDDQDCIVPLSSKTNDHFNNGKILNNPLESATDKNGLVSNTLTDWFDDAAGS